ncbi:MAG: imidazole glycerol phosphate synthase subunit HisH [Oscillospiraceae bacterium]|jgi:glutamine amidotransferase|nr:imidazole glycerol phosphate synthase subunit HisH [Oscillospiraceae bacterium]
MIVIIDYGAGNMFSVRNALEFIGVGCKFSDNPDELRKADKLILPGVGAFPDAMKMLDGRGLTEVIKEQARVKPLMGICLGMQMLFDKSFEFGETDGLGLIKGTVELMNPADLVVPHMGWNALEKETPCALSESFRDGEYVYFVHSYAAVCSTANVAAYSDYGGKIPALVFGGERESVFGCQFHPEKSGGVGLSMLKAFAELPVVA